MSENISTVKRAIIMAAGKGNRLRPVTDSVPKPLVKVNGVSMIETVISALHKNGIFDIYIVVGYLKEQFEFLKTKYVGITLIDNPYYDTCNNISSLYVAREYLGECIILDGDQIVYNPDILHTDFTLSGYSCVWQEGETDEWLITAENEIVKSCSRTGGKKGWQLYSLSRWTDNDGKRLKKHLETEFEKGNTGIYWDDVAMFCYPDDYKLKVYEIKKGDIVEVDNLEELANIDESYRKYINNGGTKNE